MTGSTLSEKRHRLYEIVEVGAAQDFVSRGYDFFSTGVLVLNLGISILNTFDEISSRYGSALLIIEAITFAFFAVDYVLRLLTARCQHPDMNEGRALLAYIFSFAGLIDLVSFLPYYLPFFFPAGAAAFRLFRVIRIFRLFRLNAYYDSLNVISEVLNRKKQQLMSSVFIIVILMLASSLCMYSLEHEAQPDVFENAFSGIWWSVATVLTVGYGDIYPVTTLGKIFSIIITFLGVGLVAIPTGIISAGFVEQYTRLQKYGDYAEEKDLSFLRFRLQKKDAWTGKYIRDLEFPGSLFIALILRDQKALIPQGDTRLQDDDILLLSCLGAMSDGKTITLKEMTLRPRHLWVGMRINDLDISRQTIIVLIRRHGTMLVPEGKTVLKEGDQLYLYTKALISADSEINI